ncbi:sinR-like protein [Haloferula helveola]|uniref:SinR-like protein n=1 Tax=Haloferula helveola TaxID=490095 RepID=A0ABM7RET6_9BACT|nr:sinR-like protein [Haloferula helveola]
MSEAPKQSYLIGYDLNAPGKDYKELIEAIKELADGVWWHNLDSTWIIRHPGPAKVILEALQAHVDDNDELLVVGLTGEGAWTGFSASGSKWLWNRL